MALVLKSNNILAGGNANDFSLLLNFESDTYFTQQNDVLTKINMLDAINFTRASTATYKDVNGFIKQAAINEPRIHSLAGFSGLLLETKRVNLLTGLNTQTITLPSFSNRTMVLSVEGTGSAKMTGEVGVSNVSAATQNNPQSAPLTYKSSGDNNSITVTVTGNVTRLQLEVCAHNQSPVYASTFTASGSSTREADNMSLKEPYASALKNAKTILCEYVLYKRIGGDGSEITEALKVLDSKAPKGGIYYRKRENLITTYTVPPNVDKDIDRLDEIDPMGLNDNSVQKIAVSYDSGTLNLSHAFNGTARSLPKTGTATDVDSLLLGGQFAAGGILTKLTIYDYKMTDAQLAEITM